MPHSPNASWFQSALEVYPHPGTDTPSDQCGLEQKVGHSKGSIIAY